MWEIFRHSSGCKLALAGMIADVVKPEQVRMPLSRKGGCAYGAYVVFVDFKAAFDKAPRDITLLRLAQAGVPPNVLTLLASIFQENSISIDDGVAELKSFTQTTGFAQGNNLSPLMFSALVADVPGIIQDRHLFVKVVFYADDLAMISSSLFHLHQALATLNKAVD